VKNNLNGTLDEMDIERPMMSIKDRIRAMNMAARNGKPVGGNSTSAGPGPGPGSISGPTGPQDQANAVSENLCVEDLSAVNASTSRQHGLSSDPGVGNANDANPDVAAAKAITQWRRRRINSSGIDDKKPVVVEMGKVQEREKKSIQQSSDSESESGDWTMSDLTKGIPKRALSEGKRLPEKEVFKKKSGMIPQQHLNSDSSDMEGGGGSASAIKIPKGARVSGTNMNNSNTSRRSSPIETPPTTSSSSSPSYNQGEVGFVMPKLKPVRRAPHTLSLVSDITSARGPMIQMGSSQKCTSLEPPKAPNSNHIKTLELQHNVNIMENKHSKKSTRQRSKISDRIKAFTSAANGTGGNMPRVNPNTNMNTSSDVRSWKQKSKSPARYPVPVAPSTNGSTILNPNHNAVYGNTRRNLSRVGNGLVNPNGSTISAGSSHEEGGTRSCDSSERQSNQDDDSCNISVSTPLASSLAIGTPARLGAQPPTPNSYNSEAAYTSVASSGDGAVAGSVGSSGIPHPVQYSFVETPTSSIVECDNSNGTAPSLHHSTPTPKQPNVTIAAKPVAKPKIKNTLQSKLENDKQKAARKAKLARNGRKQMKVPGVLVAAQKRAQLQDQTNPWNNKRQDKSREQLKIDEPEQREVEQLKDVDYSETSQINTSGSSSFLDDDPTLRDSSTEAVAGCFPEESKSKNVNNKKSRKEMESIKEQEEQVQRSHSRHNSEDRIPLKPSPRDTPTSDNESSKELTFQCIVGEEDKAAVIKKSKDRPSSKGRPSSNSRPSSRDRRTRDRETMKESMKSSIRVSIKASDNESSKDFKFQCANEVEKMAVISKSRDRPSSKGRPSSRDRRTRDREAMKESIKENKSRQQKARQSRHRLQRAECRASEALQAKQSQDSTQNPSGSRPFDTSGSKSQMKANVVKQLMKRRRRRKEYHASLKEEASRTQAKDETNTLPEIIFETKKKDATAMAPTKQSKQKMLDFGTLQTDTSLSLPPNIVRSTTKSGKQLAKPKQVEETKISSPASTNSVPSATVMDQFNEDNEPEPVVDDFIDMELSPIRANDISNHDYDPSTSYRASPSNQSSIQFRDRLDSQTTPKRANRNISIRTYTDMSFSSHIVDSNVYTTAASDVNSAVSRAYSAPLEIPLTTRINIEASSDVGATRPRFTMSNLKNGRSFAQKLTCVESHLTLKSTHYDTLSDVSSEFRATSSISGASSTASSSLASRANKVLLKRRGKQKKTNSDTGVSTDIAHATNLARMIMRGGSQAELKVHTPVENGRKLVHGTEAVKEALLEGRAQEQINSEDHSPNDQISPRGENSSVHIIPHSIDSIDLNESDIGLVFLSNIVRISSSEQDDAYTDSKYGNEQTPLVDADILMAKTTGETASDINQNVLAENENNDKENSVHAENDRDESFIADARSQMAKSGSFTLSDGFNDSSTFFGIGGEKTPTIVLQGEDLDRLKSLDRSEVTNEDFVRMIDIDTSELDYNHKNLIHNDDVITDSAGCDALLKIDQKTKDRISQVSHGLQMATKGLQLACGNLEDLEQSKDVNVSAVRILQQEKGGSVPFDEAGAMESAIELQYIPNEEISNISHENPSDNSILMHLTTSDITKPETLFTVSPDATLEMSSELFDVTSSNTKSSSNDDHAPNYISASSCDASDFTERSSYEKPHQHPTRRILQKHLLL